MNDDTASCRFEVLLFEKMTLGEITIKKNDIWLNNNLMISEKCRFLIIKIRKLDDSEE